MDSLLSRTGQWPAKLRFPLAAALFAAGFALRAAIMPLGSGFSFITFYPLAVVAFYLLGTGPGLLFVTAAAVSAATILRPNDSQGLTDSSVEMAILSFVAGGLASGWIVHRLRTALEEQGAAYRRATHAELMYEAILADQTEWIARFDVNGVLTFANDSFCRAFGVRREQVIGSAWRPMAHAEDRPYVEKQLTTICPQSPVVTVENRVYLGEGRLAWGSFVNRGIFDSEGHLIEIQSVGRDITERKRLEGERDAAALRASDLYDHAPCGYYSLSGDGTIINANETMQGWLGLPLAGLVGRRRITDFMTEEGRALFAARFPEFKRQGSLAGLEFDIVSATGIKRRMSVNANAVFDGQGQFLFSRSIMFDITEAFLATQALQRLHAEERAMLDNDLIGIFKVKDRRILWTNRGMQRMLGYEGASLEGMPTRSLYPDAATYEEVGARGYEALALGGRFRTETLMRACDGRDLWVELDGCLLPDSSGESLWTIADISELKEYQSRAEHGSLHDALTDLPNRRYLDSRLAEACARSSREGRLLCVACLDLDRFKPVNDTHGHAAGDRVLEEVATRLRSGLRAGDFVARIGGDEFILLLEGDANEHDARETCDRLMRDVARPIDLGSDAKVTISCSAGLAFFPRDGAAPGALLEHADRALYEAKLYRNESLRACAPVPQHN